MRKVILLMSSNITIQKRHWEKKIECNPESEMAPKGKKSEEIQTNGAAATTGKEGEADAEMKPESK